MRGEIKVKEQTQITGQAAKVLDGAIVAFLFLFAAAAPNSIAATQSAWLIGMALWLARFALRPRPNLHRTPVDYLLLGFFILTGLSSVLSYEPMVSIGKLRAASLFTIIYLFAENVPSLRVARLLAITLICGCMVNVFYTAGERLLGRAVKVHGVSENSPLYKAGIRDGDTLLEVDKQKLSDPQELVIALSKPDKKPAAVLTYRHELQPVFKVPRGSALPGNNPLEQLGVGGWSRGRDWRASGFYGQFVTYAEVLQLIIALVMGFFVRLPTKQLGWIVVAYCVGWTWSGVIINCHARLLARLCNFNLDYPFSGRWPAHLDTNRAFGCSPHTRGPIRSTAETQRRLYRSGRPVHNLARNCLA